MKVSYHIFGESHGAGVGVVIENLPAGIKLDLDAIGADMTRRRAKSDGTSTTRIEADLPQILSGVFEGYILSRLFDVWIYGTVSQWHTPAMYPVIFLCITVPVFIISILAGKAVHTLALRLIAPRRAKETAHA